MLAEEVSRALDELAAVIAKLKFVVAELQRAKQTELTCVREPYFTNDLVLLRQMIVCEANTGNSIPTAAARTHKLLEAA